MLNPSPSPATSAGSKGQAGKRRLPTVGVHPSGHLLGAPATAASPAAEPGMDGRCSGPTAGGDTDTHAAPKVLLRKGAGRRAGGGAALEGDYKHSTHTVPAAPGKSSSHPPPTLYL